MTGQAESGGIKALAEQAPNPHFRNIRRLGFIICFTASGKMGLVIESC